MVNRCRILCAISFAAALIVSAGILATPSSAADYGLYEYTSPVPQGDVYIQQDVRRVFPRVVPPIVTIGPCGTHCNARRWEFLKPYPVARERYWFRAPARPKHSYAPAPSSNAATAPAPMTGRSCAGPICGAR